MTDVPRKRLGMLAVSLAVGIVFSPATAPAGNQAGSEKKPVSKSAPLELGRHSGKVTATMNSGGYTYVEFEENGKKLWAAAPIFEVAAGDVIAFSGALLMRSFTSRTLKRTFDSIFFVNIMKVSAAMPRADKGRPLPKGHVPVAEKPGPPVLIAPGSLARAEGGHTVQECFEKADPLKGTTVTVRGRVVKFSEKIMSRNWIHLQDGTGAEGRNDLTVTTEASVRPGDLVVVSGKLSRNRDFGMGYFYPVLIEDASVRVEKRRP